MRFISAYMLKVFKDRPLLLPAVLLMLLMNIYVNFKPCIEYERVDYTSAVVRKVQQKLDGTVKVEVRNPDYGRLLLQTDEDITGLRVGDEIYFNGKLQMPSGPTNPGEFDYRTYLKSSGINSVLYASDIRIVRSDNWIFEVVNHIQSLSLKTRNMALSIFEEEDKALAAAIFMGDTSLVTDDVSRCFRLSNCSHLLAVSGTHFSGFLTILSAIISGFHVKKNRAAPLYIIFCMLIGTFTGWSSSVTRAAIMSICAFLARDFLSGMSLAALIMIFADPYSCLSSGFQMSFACALGIRLFAQRIQGLLEKIGLSGTSASSLGALLAATFAMMPFWGRSCYYFSFVHVAVSLLASFLATLACVFFLPSVITGLPFMCSLLLKVLLFTVRICSSVSMTGLSSRGLTVSFTVCTFIFAGLYLIPECIIRDKLLKTAFLGLVLSFVFMLTDIIFEKDLKVVFIDVGQGDCCLVMYDGKSILIDSGTEEEGRYAVVPVLDYYGIDKVDMAVASHMDEDHIGGLNFLESKGRIDNFITCYDVLAGDTISINDDLKLYCLWPYEVTDGGNEDSIVLKLTYEDTSILFTGDIGFESEERILDAASDVDCDILKIAHHGSKYSTSEEFIEAASPELAIISVGKYNGYGHPSDEVLERLKNNRCTVRRTDWEGAIILEF